MGERILVVDDDAHHAAIVRDGLTYHGYDVDSVGDGPACLTAVGAHPPQLVVLDRMLPGMDGVEVCQRICQNSAHSPAKQEWRGQKRRTTLEIGPPVATIREQIAGGSSVCAEF